LKSWPERNLQELGMRTFTNMPRFQRYSNLVAVFLPFAAFLAAIVLLWNEAVGWTDLGILAAMYATSAFGVTIGFHRLLTHRSFRTHRPVEYALAVCGSMAVQGPVIDWVADHRKHHAHTDEEGDPHSPHVGHGSGLRGLWHAHVGWLFDAQGQANRRKYAPDLMDDPGMRAINRHFLAIVGLSLALPFAAGFAIGGTLSAALGGLLWGGLVRIFFVHHVTWSINSICHFHGRRRFATDDRSTNVWWLSLASLGESWHHNHHAFPRSAVHGLRRWELDPTGAAIRLMKRLGLAWNVVEITPERQEERLA
jgi:stearoyl-CoA desaturase (delta-9 desaturase)